MDAGDLKWYIFLLYSSHLTKSRRKKKLWWEGRETNYYHLTGYEKNDDGIPHEYTFV